jgi:hypothetical protein
MTNLKSISFSTNGIAIGGNTANVMLDVSAGNDAIAVAVGNTAQRPNGQPGFFRYNKDIQEFEGFTTFWGSLGGGEILVQNNNVAVNVTEILDFSNGPNVIMMVTDDYPNNRVNVFIDALSANGGNSAAYDVANAALALAANAYALANEGGGGSGGGANVVTVLANDGVVLANALINFNNTATVNVHSSANGTYESNISFSVNASAIADNVTNDYYTYNYNYVIGDNITPDSHPAIANVADDEFEYGTSLDTTGARFSGAIPWTIYGNTNITQYISNGSIRILSNVGAGATRAATVFGQPLPSGNTWEYTSKFSMQANTNYNLCGICCYESSTGKCVEWGWLFNPGFTIYMFAGSLTNLTTFNLDLDYYIHLSDAQYQLIDQQTNQTPFRYWKLARNGGYLILSVSTDGIVFYPYITDLAISSQFTSAPDTIGLFIDATNGANATTMVVDWFRRTDSYVPANSNSFPFVAGANVVTVLANDGVVVANAIINFNNTATVNVGHSANGTYASNISFSVNTSAVGGGSGGGANVVTVKANDTVVVANARINFNNTATINVVASANGTYESNIGFTMNTAAIPGAGAAYNQANNAYLAANNAYNAANVANGTANAALALAANAYTLANSGAFSIANNGYVTLEPSGIILQWGANGFTTTGNTVSFPIPFPNQCFSVTIAREHQSDAPSMGVSNVTTSNFIGWVGSTPGIFYWQAVGN